MPTGQAMGSTWYTENAAAYGGDAVKGPWLLSGAAFGSQGVPPQNGAGQYLYYMAQDTPAADGTALVVAADVFLDPNGHEVKYANAAPVSGLNSEFEADTPGSPPAGWDLSGSAEAPPVVYSPTANGVFNTLFGDNVLAWRGGGGVPVPVNATLSLDGSNHVVLTFGGSAPATGRQVWPANFTTSGGTYANRTVYYVINSSGSACNLSLTAGGAAVTATAVTGASGQVSVGQTIRTSSAIAIPKANVYYCFALAMSCDPPDGYAATGAYTMPVQMRVFAADGVTQVGSSVSGTTRPACTPIVWLAATTAGVYLEATIFLMNVVGGGAMPVSPVSAWFDAVRLRQAFDYGIMATPLDGADLGSVNGIVNGPRPQLAWPAAIQSAYGSCKSFAYQDSAGGARITQGQAKSAFSTAVQPVWSGHTFGFRGLSAGAPAVITVTGDNSPVIDLSYFAAAAPGLQPRTVQYLTYNYVGDIDVYNRQHYGSGLVVEGYNSDIVIDHVTATGIPQMAVAVTASTTGEPAAVGGATVTVSNFAFTGNVKVTNSFLILCTYTEGITIGPGTIGGHGYGIGFYPGNPTHDLTGAIAHVLVHDVDIDVTVQPEREYCGAIVGHAVKLKTVDPGPYASFRDVLFRDCNVTIRNLGGVTKGVRAVSVDVVNGGGLNGGSGGVRFLNCDLESVIDSTASPFGGAQTSTAVQFDYCAPQNFPVFENCTLAGTYSSVSFNGADGRGCQGAVFDKCTLKYLPVAGITNTYQAFQLGLNQNFVTNTYILDSVWDSSVTAPMRGVRWAGQPNPGPSFTPLPWAVNLTAGGTGYGSAPTPSLAGNGTTYQAVMGPDGLGNATGAVAGVGVSVTPAFVASGYIDQPPPAVTFTGGSPATPAAGNLVLVGSSWPYKSLYIGSGLNLTVVDAGTGAPVAGASVTVTDAANNQWFPAVPGSTTPAGSAVIGGLTDAAGHVGLAADVPVIPLPATQLCQGDAVGRQTTPAIAGTCLLDGSSPSFTSGSASSRAVTSGYTLTITAAGYATFTHALAVGTPITLTANLSTAGAPTQYLLLRPGP